MYEELHIEPQVHVKAGDKLRTSYAKVLAVRAAV